MAFVLRIAINSVGSLPPLGIGTTLIVVVTIYLRDKVSLSLVSHCSETVRVRPIIIVTVPIGPESQVEVVKGTVVVAVAVCRKDPVKGLGVSGIGVTQALVFGVDLLAMES